MLLRLHSVTSPSQLGEPVSHLRESDHHCYITVTELTTPSLACSKFKNRERKRTVKQNLTNIAFNVPVYNEDKR